MFFVFLFFLLLFFFIFFFFNDTATTEIYTLSLHDALSDLMPCRVEHPLLMRLKQEGRVTLYGIDYKDKPEEARRLLAQLGDPYRHIGVDRDGRTAIDFGVYGVPETYVID